MSEIALASINSFAYIEGKADSSVQPSEDLLITLTLGQLRELIEEAIRPLQEELQDLRVRQDALEERISEPPVQRVAELEIGPLQPIVDHERLQDLGVRVIGLELAQDELEKMIVARSSAPPRGEKTLARLSKIEEVLRERGSCTLKELEHILKIDKATMTGLLAKLDKRRFEVFTRPGDRRQKVLRLRAQIR